MPDTERRTLSVEEAARIIGISRTTAYACVRSGAIPSVRYGKRIVIPRWVVERPLTEPTVSDEPPMSPRQLSSGE